MAKKEKPIDYDKIERKRGRKPGTKNRMLVPQTQVLLPLPVLKTEKLSESEIMQMRVDYIIECLVMGYSEWNTLKMLKKEFDIGKDTSLSDLARAKEQLKARSEEKKEYLRSCYNDMFLHVYRLCLEAGNHKTCVDIIANLAKLNRLYEVVEGDRIMPVIQYLRSSTAGKQILGEE